MLRFGFEEQAQVLALGLAVLWLLVSIEVAVSQLLGWAGGVRRAGFGGEAADG